MFDWSDLRVALAVARGGSIAAAAKQLGVDASTVTRRLRALGRGLNSRLFERTAQGLRPTAAGEQVIAAAVRMEQEAIALERNVNGTDTRVEGTVRLTTTESLSDEFLSIRLAPLLEQHPRLHLEVVTGDHLLDLSRSEADLAIRNAATEREGLIARKLAVMGHTVYAARSYLARYGTPKTPADLRAHRCVGFPEGLMHTAEMKWLAQHAGHARFVLQSASTLTLLGAALGGAGVVMLPCYIGDGRPELVRLFGPEAVVQRDLWLVFHSELRKAARVRAVVDHLVAVFREGATLLATGRAGGG